MITSSPEYMTRREVARTLRLSADTVSRLIRDGELPGAFRVVGRGDIRIPTRAVQEYIRRQTVGGGE